ncbi:hypothetical protein SISSUDRAFT_1037006 [Sistotremastrum suecicum HHB10207 ss-3]|uniref:Spindle assembly checkpoint component MAD1 n=1 Tax=Sistotremastrum suecicum HHB10207 ss-3 TaxID=1314776 RepID=A0A165YPU9_9AGAM|nr:hypothetical protein SISSUDRAFT_1037006 [Sistotremastrum suecicum HHB10207 ss-3]
MSSIPPSSSSAAAKNPGQWTPSSSLSLSVSAARSPTKRDSLSASLDQATAYSSCSFLPLPYSSVTLQRYAASLRPGSSLPPADPLTSSIRRKERTAAFEAQMTTASLERKLVLSEERTRELERSLREKDVVIARLESDRRFLGEREREERESKEVERTQHENETRKNESTIRALRASLATLSSEHEDLKDTHSSLLRSSNLNEKNSKSQIASLTHQIALLQDELENSREEAKEKGRTAKDLLAKIEALSLSSHPPSYDSSFPDSTYPNTNDASATSDSKDSSRRSSEKETLRILSTSLSKSQSALKSLESQNAHLQSQLFTLREKAKLASILQEEKAALERKVAGVQALRERCAQLEGEVEELKAGERRGVEEGEAKRELAEMRLKFVKLMDEYGSSTAELRSVSLELEAVQAELAETKEELGRTRENETRERERGERGERRVAVERAEVAVLKELLESYKNEGIMTASLRSAHHDDQSPSHPINADAAEVDANEEDEVKPELRESPESKRIEFLESKIASLQAMNDSLEATLQDTIRRADPKLLLQAEAALQKAHSESSSLRKELDSTLDKLDKTEQTLFELRGEIATGSHVPPNTRIVMMKDNPMSEWEGLRRGVVEGLKKENGALLKRIGELESELGEGEGTGRMDVEGETGLFTSRESTGVIPGRGAGVGGGGGMVPRESWERMERERDALEEVVRQRDKRLLRLQEVFKAKSQEFREAISSILGFKLAFYPNGQVRVTSQYDLGASFVFQPSSLPSSSSNPTSSSISTSNSANSQTGAGSLTSSSSGGGRGIKMQLVGQSEGGPEDIGGLVEYWVNGEMCIPGLMASVTLECYEKM